MMGTSNLRSTDAALKAPVGRPRRWPNPTTAWCPTCKAPVGQRCKWPRHEARDDDDSHRTRYRAVGTIRGNAQHSATIKDPHGPQGNQEA